MKVGFLGLGNMGMPIARNLLRAGYSLTVYNRTPGRAGELAAEPLRQWEIRSPSCRHSTRGRGLVIGTHKRPPDAFRVET